MIRKETKHFILRLGNPFIKDANDSYDNEDLSTLCSKEIFEGFIIPFDDKLIFEKSEKCFLGYDVVSHIDSTFYTRIITRGKYVNKS